ncbi:uncharacterized protein LTR77_004776 [Saxophila tyrrhenica]|uniref:Uncharacterized protein n=1 Tax=Saxophila tyrrhenica TaxID=1690608 RepID=A0AAV9PE77_9PEZI|nr:hypothetical protein LTR77_004776 [Saxophila tyrrhenica]
MAPKPLQGPASNAPKRKFDDDTNKHTPQPVSDTTPQQPPTGSENQTPGLGLQTPSETTAEQPSPAGAMGVQWAGQQQNQNQNLTPAERVREHGPGTSTFTRQDLRQQQEQLNRQLALNTQIPNVTHEAGHGSSSDSSSTGTVVLASMTDAERAQLARERPRPHPQTTVTRRSSLQGEVRRAGRERSVSFGGTRVKRIGSIGQERAPVDDSESSGERSPGEVDDEVGTDDGREPGILERLMTWTFMLVMAPRQTLSAAAAEVLMIVLTVAIRINSVNSRDIDAWIPTIQGFLGALLVLNFYLLSFLGMIAMAWILQELPVHIARFEARAVALFRFVAAVVLLPFVLAHTVLGIHWNIALLAVRIFRRIGGDREPERPQPNGHPIPLNHRRHRHPPLLGSPANQPYLDAHAANPAPDVDDGNESDPDLPNPEDDTRFQSLLRRAFPWAHRAWLSGLDHLTMLQANSRPAPAASRPRSEADAVRDAAHARMMRARAAWQDEMASGALPSDTPVDDQDQVTTEDDGRRGRTESTLSFSQADEEQDGEEAEKYEDDEPLLKVHRDRSPPQPPPPSGGGGICYSLDFGSLDLRLASLPARPGTAHGEDEDGISPGTRGKSERPPGIPNRGLSDDEAGPSAVSSSGALGRGLTTPHGTSADDVSTQALYSHPVSPGPVTRNEDKPPGSQSSSNTASVNGESASNSPDEEGGCLPCTLSPLKLPYRLPYQRRPSNTGPEQALQRYKSVQPKRTPGSQHPANHAPSSQETSSTWSAKRFFTALRSSLDDFSECMPCAPSPVVRREEAEPEREEAAEPERPRLVPPTAQLRENPGTGRVRFQPQPLLPPLELPSVGGGNDVLVLDSAMPWKGKGREVDLPAAQRMKSTFGSGLDIDREYPFSDFDGEWQRPRPAPPAARRRMPLPGTRSNIDCEYTSPSEAEAGQTPRTAASQATPSTDKGNLPLKENLSPQSSTTVPARRSERDGTFAKDTLARFGIFAAGVPEEPNPLRFLQKGPVISLQRILGEAVRSCDGFPGVTTFSVAESAHGAAESDVLDRADFVQDPASSRSVADDITEASPSDVVQRQKNATALPELGSEAGDLDEQLDDQVWSAFALGGVRGRSASVNQFQALANSDVMPDEGKELSDVEETPRKRWLRKGQGKKARRPDPQNYTQADDLSWAPIDGTREPADLDAIRVQEMVVGQNGRSLPANENQLPQAHGPQARSEMPTFQEYAAARQDSTQQPASQLVVEKATPTKDQKVGRKTLILKLQLFELQEPPPERRQFASYALAATEAWVPTQKDGFDRASAQPDNESVSTSASQRDRIRPTRNHGG